ncbi:MAG: hypothetical protein OXD46_03005 [Chloroflexi bacterium]|nr:hypothetical protein [Chloroflexota bacterium]
MRRFRDYRGVEVLLSDAVLFDHILTDHPEPVDYVREIEKALSNPVVPAFPDPRRANGLRYYGWVEEFGKYIRVAVKVLDNEAWVSTAFLTDRLA